MNTKNILQGYLNLNNPVFSTRIKSWKDDEELISLLKQNESNFDVEEYIQDIQFMVGHEGIDAFKEIKYILRQEIEIKMWIKEYGPFTL